MARTQSVADQYILNLKRTFATQQFTIAEGYSTGIPVKDRPSDFPIFMQALLDNSNYETLTDLERDQIIDYCLKLTTQ